MSIPVDYEILRVIWWLFLGVLLIGFAIMDGFDLGVATLLPFVARTETERRVAINTIGPVSLSQTSSGWQLIENQAILLWDEGSLQAHWLDDRRSAPVAGNA